MESTETASPETTRGPDLSPKAARYLRGGHLSLPTKDSTSLEAFVAVLDEVSAAISEVDAPSWQKELARSLATAMDEAPNASTAKELRLLMGELGTAEAAKPKGDVSDDLAAKRAARRSASGS